MQVGFKSDKGAVRSNNEDACFVLLPDKVYVIADGVGGGNSGEIASRTAVNEVANYVVEHPISLMTNKYAIVNYIQAAVDNANTKVFNMARNYSENTGMATTLIVTYITDGKAYIANIGDSRVYLYRSGQLVQVTEDHTYLNTLVKAGILTKEQASMDDRKNVITKALGAEKTCEPDFFNVDIQAGDVFIVCTDGLYNEVSQEEMIEMIREKGTMSDLVERLIQRANENGGNDNITAITLKVTEEDI